MNACLFRFETNQAQPKLEIMNERSDPVSNRIAQGLLGRLNPDGSIGIHALFPKHETDKKSKTKCDKNGLCRIFANVSFSFRLPCLRLGPCIRPCASCHP